MFDQNIRKSPFEDQIVEMVAQNIGNVVVAEIREEVAIQVANSATPPSSKVRNTEITELFLERLSQQLAKHQDQVTGEINQQIVERQRQVAAETPTVLALREILRIGARRVDEIKSSFKVHVHQCAVLSARIETEKIRYENRNVRIEKDVERDLKKRLSEDAEMWVQMGLVSWDESSREWDEEYGDEV